MNTENCTNPVPIIHGDLAYYYHFIQRWIEKSKILQ